MTAFFGQERFIAAALAGGAVLVAVLAVPVIGQSLRAQHAIDVIAALRHYEQVPDGDVEDALAALGAGHATGDRLAERAILSLVLAQRLEEESPRREALLADTVRLSEQRLGRAPSDTHAWTRLAYAGYLLNGPTEEVIAALRRSHEAGPREYYALWARLRLGVILWPFLDEALREATLAQAVTAMRADGGTYRLARLYQKLPSNVQAALVDAIRNKPGWADFERYLVEVSAGR